jgi:penicillin-insensitive murein endopeptidase
VALGIRTIPATIAAMALPILPVMPVLGADAHPELARPHADWSSAAGPTAGPPHIIGGHGSACIAGAVELPAEGAGFQAVDISRRRHYGHPALVAFVEALGRKVAAARIGTMLVGDMAQPRGGPMSFGHVSHQSGLDVDILFRLEAAPVPAGARDGLAHPNVVDARTGRIDPRLWTDRQVELVRLAAMDARVSRVFVGAALKRDLCARAWPDRGFLRDVRPWPDHDDHLHVRLRCPADSPDCSELAAPVSDEGCTPGELAAAFAHERAWRRRPPPAPKRALPVACEIVLGDAPLLTTAAASRSD